MTKGNKWGQRAHDLAGYVYDLGSCLITFDNIFLWVKTC